MEFEKVLWISDFEKVIWISDYHVNLILLVICIRFLFQIILFMQSGDLLDTIFTKSLSPVCLLKSLFLIHFQPMFQLYTSWKHQKTSYGLTHFNQCSTSIPPENIRKPYHCLVSYSVLLTSLLLLSYHFWNPLTRTSYYNQSNSFLLVYIQWSQCINLRTFLNHMHLWIKNAFLDVFILLSGQCKNFRRALGTCLTPKLSNQHFISILAGNVRKNLVIWHFKCV